MESISFVDQLGYLLSVWYVSFFWHSMLIVAGLSLVLLFYRKYGARVKSLMWALSIPMMVVVPLIAGMASRGHIAVYEVNVPSFSYKAERQAETIMMGMDDTAIPEEKTAVTAPQSIFDYPYALFFSLYAVVVVVMLGIYMAGRKTLRRIVLRATPVLDVPSHDLVARCKKSLGISRPVLFVESPETTVPFTCGVFHPVIVFPMGLLSRISPHETISVIYHELAHIRRFDAPLMSLAAILRALFFFNPFIWYAASKLSFFAEESCDELVVEHSGKPVQYARTLTSIAETLKNRPMKLEFATGLVFSRWAFLRRIESILSLRTRRIVKLTRIAAMGLVFVSAILTASVVVFPVASQAVDFRGGMSVESKLASLRDEAPTPEKREAITRIMGYYKQYRQCTLAAIQCSKIVLDAERNIPVIVKLAEYALSYGSNTMTYIGIAEYAAKSNLATDEFWDLAELARTYGSESMTMVKLARKAAHADNESELKEARSEIRDLERKLAASSTPRYALPKKPAETYMTLDEVDKKMDSADTPEKRAAINQIRKVLKKYKRHYKMTECVDLILEADRNVDVIRAIAEYGITTPYHTFAFADVAEYAAIAPLADKEFIDIAKLVKNRLSGTAVFVDLARQASQAQDDDELDDVRRKIRLEESKSSSVSAYMVTGVLNMLAGMLD